MEMKKPSKEEKISELSKKIAEQDATDVVLLNAPLERGMDNKFMIEANKRRKRENLLLMLVTPGGDADTAYRIARFAQEHYEKFTVFVSGYCKSAGTLCVLGAQEIVVSDQGELGPLDVQFYKKDELDELSSGLVIGEALDSLQDQAFAMFEQYMLAMKRKSGGQISLKMATATAASLVAGLYEPIYRQIDPMLIGDVGRSMAIAKDYGTRLLAGSQNCSEENLQALIESYPSHGFVIDRMEAEQIFNHVRAPSDDEERLARVLAPRSRVPLTQDKSVIEFLSPPPPKVQATQETANGQGAAQEAQQGAESGSAAGDPRRAAA